MRNGSMVGAAGLLVAMIALVVAVAGGAVALPGKNTVDSGDIRKKAVKSRHIGKNAVKGKHIAPSARRCPGGMSRVQGLCYERSSNPAATHTDAMYACAQKGRELPTWAQLLRVAHTAAYPVGGSQWTTDRTGAGNVITVQKIASDNIQSVQLAGSSGYRCVQEATP